MQDCLSNFKVKSHNNETLIQTSCAKLIWIACVCAGFLSSVILIKGSYDKWQESPIETTISTHALDDLDFPRVTVCPQKGSNTALNYDLMRADNDSFSKDMRTALQDYVWKTLVEDQHKNYIEEMLDLATPSNIQSIYDGYQSVPKPYGDSREFQITFENVNGTYQYPRDQERDLVKNHDLYCVLDFMYLARTFATWSLVVQLVNNPGGKTVEIRKGPKYVLFTQKRSWAKAEKSCQEIGGHLASIRSKREQQQVEELLEERRYTKRSVWIGAKRNRKGAYEWNDGTDMNFTQWRNPEWENNCGYILDGDWYKQSCTSLCYFICKLIPQKFENQQTVSLEYKKEELYASQFHSCKMSHLSCMNMYLYIKTSLHTSKMRKLKTMIE